MRRAAVAVAGRARARAAARRMAVARRSKGNVRALSRRAAEAPPPSSSAAVSTSAASPVAPPAADAADASAQTLEVQDPALIFETVWQNLIQRHGEMALTFPKDILWLAGAPGAGKGRMTPFIMQGKGVNVPPLEISTLLNSPQCQELKRQGQLVSDRLVVELLFEKLLEPQYRSGMIVDGFPRTRTQAECIKRLFDKMRELRRKFDSTPEGALFRRPIYHIMVLYVEEEESVRRQLLRGERALAHNQQVETTGVGSLQELRPTDLDRNLARERYRLFREQVYESLQVIKKKFHFHFINAEGTIDEVQERIRAELDYQSSMELGDETFQIIRHVPLASEVIESARHELVRRLDRYVSTSPELFDRVLNLITSDFMPIVGRQALAGKAIIRSESDVLDEDGAIDMMLDVFAERGFTVVLDKQRRQFPVALDHQTYKIITEVKRVWEFQIEFPRPSIRRG